MRREKCRCAQCCIQDYANELGDCFDYHLCFVCNLRGIPKARLAPKMSDFLCGKFICDWCHSSMNHLFLVELGYCYAETDVTLLRLAFLAWIIKKFGGELRNRNEKPFEFPLEDLGYDDDQDIDEDGLTPRIRLKHPIVDAPIVTLKKFNIRKLVCDEAQF
jgi:hypothetical protein